MCFPWLAAGTPGGSGEGPAGPTIDGPEAPQGAPEASMGPGGVHKPGVSKGSSGVGGGGKAGPAGVHKPGTSGGVVAI